MFGVTMKLRFWCLFGLTSILLGCSSAPKEEYFDYFYTTKTSKEAKDFTYILYLGAEGDRSIPNESLGEHAPAQSGSHGSKQRAAPKGKKGGVNDFMSLSFRMEEEAFKRLEKRLQEENYCNEEPSYSLNEYTWLAYTIKGSCG